MLSVSAHDGAKIDVHVRGAGPTILMHPQPAWPGSGPELSILRSALDKELTDALSNRYRLVLFEYPGDTKPYTMTPTAVVRDLLAIADVAEADQFAWCGYSWTAVAGLQLALETDRMTALVCGGWPPIRGPYKEILKLVLDPGTTYLTPETRQQFITFYRALEMFDDRCAQARITCPRLCFVGSADNYQGLGIGPTVMSERASLETAGWDVRILEGLDHGEPLQPEVFVPLVTGWFDEHLDR